MNTEYTNAELDSLIYRARARATGADVHAVNETTSRVRYVKDQKARDRIIAILTDYANGTEAWNDIVFRHDPSARDRLQAIVDRVMKMPNRHPDWKPPKATPRMGW